MINNTTITRDKLAQNAFAVLLAGLGAGRLLDVGANLGSFALEIRALGYTGLIYSVEPQASCQRRLSDSSRGDLRWIVAPNQGAGAENEVMNLNVTANGHSSSFLVPDANHLRAEPSTRVVGGEWVYVAKTSDLLPPVITGAIDALKIDTQGYELNVLKGLGTRFTGLKLIMAELSAIPTYVGGPSLDEVEHHITEVLGFARVSLTPAYVDETTGEVQQYDGIYVRRDLLAAAEALLAAPSRHRSAAPDGTGVVLDAVVVSLPPRPPKRPDQFGRDFGAGWLESCHKSWAGYAPRVISISEAEPILPDVRWRKVAEKPELRQIFGSLAEQPPPGKGSILLTNADIILGPQLRPLLAQMDRHVMYYCSRLDVLVAKDDPRNLELVGEYSNGYDAFFLPREIIADIHEQQLLPAGLKIGEPFWDYALPIAALVAGHPTKKFFAKPHPIVHLKHEAVSGAYLDKTSDIFRKWLAELLRRPASPVSGMIAEFISEYEGAPGNNQAKRRAMCSTVIAALT